MSNKDVGHSSSSSSTQTGRHIRKNKAKSSNKSLDKGARKTNHGEVSGEGDTTGEDESNGDDEASSDELDDDEADDEEPEVFAPSGGAKKCSQDEDDLESNTAGCLSPNETAYHQAGQYLEICESNNKRKRTLSEMTTDTVLSTIELDELYRDGCVYPRRKRADQRLSSTGNGPRK